MSVSLPNPRPIKGLSPQAKANLVVSNTLIPDGTMFVVSRYGDEVWKWRFYIEQENLCLANKQIAWDIALPDGRLLTDPKHAVLLESTKDFIWTLFADPVEGRKRPMFFTLTHKFKDTIPLLRWMVNQGLSHFEDLAGRTLDYVPVAKLDVNGEPLAPHTANLRLMIVEDIFRQREKLNDALKEHPWPHESALSLAGVKSKTSHRKPKTQIIPDAVAFPLCEAALDYVQNRSARILAARGNADEAAEDKVGYHPSTIAHSRAAAACAAGYEGSDDLRQEVIRLRTACYIVIDLFAAIRDSEVMSLSDGCMAHGKNKDNIDVYWLHGTIYKTGKRPHRWLVPPLVKVAVDVLTRLTAPLREQLRQEEADIKARIGMSIASERLRLVERFDTVSKHKDKLFLARSMSTKGGSISVLSGRAMSVDLKDFCANLGIHDKDGQPYALHAHQFRRTYAYFMARSRFGDPLTLRAHFGHYSWDMTAVYMDDGIDGYEADIELLNMVEMFMLDLHNDISRRLADSDDSMANGGQWLTELRKVVRTSKNKEEVIREFAGSITIAGNGYAYCIGNPNDRGCGGLCILEPQMCLDCNCGVIMQEHRPVWQAIRDQQMEVLELDDVGLGGRARAQKILAAAEKVLCLLDEKD